MQPCWQGSGEPIALGWRDFQPTRTGPPVGEDRGRRCRCMVLQLLDAGCARRSDDPGTAMSTVPLGRCCVVRAAFPLLALITSAAWGGSVPVDRSLTPLKVEWVRTTYGQEALFRMRLGIDSARDDGASCPAKSLVWSGSAQEGLLERQLRDGRPYAAGLILGAWQLRQQRCGGGSVLDGVASPVPH